MTDDVLTDLRRYALIDLVEAYRSGALILAASTEPDGEWVRYEQVAALVARVKQAEQERDHLKAENEQVTQVKDNALDLLRTVVKNHVRIARIQTDFADDLADREGNIYEQVKDLVEQFHAERASHEQDIEAAFKVAFRAGEDAGEDAMHGLQTPTPDQAWDSFKAQKTAQ